MPKLAAVVEDINTIPAELRDNYVEDAPSKTWILDIDDSPYKKKLEEFRTNNNKLTGEKKDLLGKLDKFKDVDMEKYGTAMEAYKAIEHQQDAELLKKGDIDAVVKKRTEGLQKDFDTKLAAQAAETKAATERAEKFRNRLSIQIDNVIRRVVEPVAAVKATAWPDVMGRARQVFRIDDDGEVVPMDQDGNPVYSTKKPEELLTPEEFAASLLTTAPHFFETTAGGGARGSKGDPQGGNKGGAPMVDRKDIRAFGKNLEGIASGKTKVVPTATPAALRQ